MNISIDELEQNIIINTHRMFYDENNNLITDKQRLLDNVKLYGDQIIRDIKTFYISLRDA